jgi:Domain of unknown function (DUF4303)/Trypsin-like peptidase domain
MSLTLRGRVRAHTQAVNDVWCRLCQWNIQWCWSALGLQSCFVIDPSMILTDYLAYTSIRSSQRAIKTMRLKVTPSDMTTRFLFTTARIAVLDGSGKVVATGTGYYFSSGNKDYLVTNKHVIEGALGISIPVHRATRERPQYVMLGDHFTHSVPMTGWYFHPDPQIDVCCIPVDTLFNGIDAHEYFYLPIHATAIVDQELPASIGVAMIGYPNGMWDEANGLPIIRMGTTASHPSVRFNNKSEVVLDLACFPGSSGSPVMYYEPRHFSSAEKFLGMLYAGPTIALNGEVLVSKIPTSHGKDVTVRSMMHLGYAIQGNVVRDFIFAIESGAVVRLPFHVMFATLAFALRSAMERHYRLLVENYGSEELYGYSLYTEDGVSSIGPVANTNSGIAVDTSDPSYNRDKYGPNEWSLWDDHGLFDAANDIVKEIHADASADFDFKRDGILQAAFFALKTVEAAGLFGPRSATRFCTLWLSDSADPIMHEAARALNSEEAYECFSSQYPFESKSII